MLVDDKQAREKIAQILDDLRCPKHFVDIVRELSLKDCKVEARYCPVSFAHPAHDSCDGSPFDAIDQVESLSAHVEEHQKYADEWGKDIVALSDARSSIVELQLRAEAAESQVAELKKDAERMAGVISRGNCPECHGWMCHNSDCSVYALIKNFLSAAKESGVSP